MLYCEYIKIHPYEDGNNRTIRLIINHNLISQGLDGVTFRKEDLENLNNARDIGDINFISNLFKNSILTKRH